MSTQRFVLADAPLDQGTVLLEASAGTGKTYTLVGILLRMLLEGAIDRIDQALVVTFTVAATDELKNRLRTGLLAAIAVCEGAEADDPFFRGLARHGDKGARILRTALDQFDQVAITTIHGFCKRLLDESAFESREPFELEFTLDELPLWERAAEDALRTLRRLDSPALGALLHTNELTPTKLVAHYRLWQRYPDVRLEPVAPDPAAHIDTLRSAAMATAGHFDDQVRQRLLGYRWNAGKNPLAPDPASSLDRLQRTLRLAPEQAIPTLRDLAARHLAGLVDKRSKPKFDHPFLAACDAVRNAFDAATAHVRSALLHCMHTQAELHKHTFAVLSFSDLLVRTAAALHDPVRSHVVLPALQGRYRTALIDEFQDTDPIQYSIFARCFGNSPLFLVGDPKQSIYSFRGADLQTYYTARTDAIATRTLDQNQRSSRQMVDATNLLFARDNAFVDPRLRFAPVQAARAEGSLQIAGDPGGALRWRFLPPASDKKDGLWPVNEAEARIAADVTAEIARLLNAGCSLDEAPLQPRHIAVLTRTNKQATLVQDTLRDAGIVSAIGKAGDVFATDELDEIEQVLLAILHPNDLRKARAAMSTRLWGLDAATLLRLEAEEAAFDRELARLERWRHTWLRRGFVVMKEQLLDDLDTVARLLAITGGERRLTNCQQLFEMLHQAEHEHHLSPEGLLQWLQHERGHQDEIDYQRRELRLESDEDAVQILTVHGSKGLQYEVVFCPFAWGGRGLPNPPVLLERNGIRQIAFDATRTDPAYLASDGERLAEDVRLCYVAITRAKRRCYVHWGPIGSNKAGCWRSGLAWLLRPEPPDQSQPDWPTTWAQDCKADVPRFAGQLLALVARSGGTMTFDEVPERPVPEPVRLSFPADTSAPRRAERKPRAFALHSFTSMVKGAASVEPVADVVDPATPSPIDAPEAPLHGIFAFQRGPVAGQCLHAILEHIDLDQLEGTAATELVRTTLHRFGLLAKEAHDGPLDPVACVLANLRAVAAARIDASGPSIAELCRTHRFAEWPFALPVPHAEVRGLATLFRRHGGDVASGYAPRLELLPQRTLRGFLTGFADLVTEHDGRYWVLDWKSNHLGGTTADYGPAALAAVMHEHDYVLQYHLYLLALHRHLALRLPGYAPERHLGGACYVFVRGATAGNENGVFCDRPAVALLLAMDRWAAGAAEAQPHGTPAGGGR